MGWSATLSILQSWSEACMRKTIAQAGGVPAPPSLGALVLHFWRRHKWSYFFIAPSMILFTVFILYPVLQAVVLAFQKFNMRGSTWVGLKNFADVFASPLFRASMVHTLVYALFV